MTSGPVHAGSPRALTRYAHIIKALDGGRYRTRTYDLVRVKHAL